MGGQYKHILPVSLGVREESPRMLIIIISHGFCLLHRTITRIPRGRATAFLAEVHNHVVGSFLAYLQMSGTDGSVGLGEKIMPSRN